MTSPDMVQYMYEKAITALRNRLAQGNTTSEDADNIMIEHLEQVVDLCPCCGHAAAFDLYTKNLKNYAEIFCPSKNCELEMSELEYGSYDQLVSYINKWNRRVHG